MNLEEWARIKPLLGSALERAPEERAAFLDNACGGDETLRRQIEALLSAYESEPSLMGETGPSAAPQTAAAAGARIGPYQVIRQIGEGGMGAVYLASRADDTFHKNVAIKLVQTAIDSQDLLQRFRHERQILATLDHPNIARLVDGGSTADGLPYFVMDYVDGVRIDEYCQIHKLKTAERVELFLGVCAAVQYVHQNLVVHRDLKPGNIVVTSEGVPKLLDFGIAKLLKPEMFTNMVDATRAEFRLMTPGYASPEQVKGETITTASDVYSLGVILYELLTARRPYRLKTDSPAEILRAVCDQEPEKPSTAITRAGDAGAIAAARATTPEKLKKQLSGDLDAIVGKALRKEPQSRYTTVEQFAEDLRRHLRGLPVSAYRDTWKYRSGKFVRRHKAGVAAAGLLAASLVGGVLTTTWQARKAQAERANARQQFNDVRKLATSFLFEFHDAIENLPGSTPARKLVVQRALEYLAKLAARAQGDASLQRELAEAYLKIGDVQGNPYVANLGDTLGAERSYRESLRISQALVEANSADVDARHDLAKSHELLGEVLPILGKPTEGLAELRKGTELLEAMATEAPADAKIASDLAGCYQALGDLQGHSGLQNLGDPAAALASYRKALAIFQSQVSRQENLKVARRGLAVVEIRIGDLAIAGGDAKEGGQQYRSALALTQELNAADRSDKNSIALLALVYEKIGAAQEEKNPAEARRSYTLAAEINQRQLDADPYNEHAAMSLALTLRYAGDLEDKLGNRAAALAQYQKVLQILERFAAVDSKSVLMRGRYAEMLTFTADLLARGGTAAEARRMAAQSLAITRELAARADATADDLYQYAETFLTCTPADLREPATALEFAKRSVEKSGGADSDALNLLAEAYFKNGDAPHAVQTERQAIAAAPLARRTKMERRLEEFQAAEKGK